MKSSRYKNLYTIQKEKKNFNYIIENFGKANYIKLIVRIAVLLLSNGPHCINFQEFCLINNLFIL